MSRETDRAIRRAQQLETTGTASQESDSDVLRSTGTMAIATLLSRITGFIKATLLGASLGAAVFSSFNSANQLPNLVTEIVLGAVLTSLVVPVLVRAEKEDPDHGASFIRRLITVSSVLLIVVTVVCVAAAPLLTRLSLDPSGKVNVYQATNFAYLVLPQIFFYGISALLMAILNTKGVFKPGAWAPVWNNIVVLFFVTLYWVIPGGLAPNDNGSFTNIHMLILGLGATLGVVVQAVVLIPPLRKIGIDLRPEWGIDSRIKQFAGMGIAIVVYVAISQAGYFVTNRIASMADNAAPGVYSQAWLLLQMPYGIIGVTLLTAIMPRLSRNAADNNTKGVVRDLTVATKLTMIGILPVVVFMLVFGPEIGVALYAYGRFSVSAATAIGLTVALSAFTLIPYSIVLLHLRVFYAREQAWTPTFIIIAITTTKIILSSLAITMAPNTESVVILLGVANGCAFIAGAGIGAYLLKRSIGTLNSREVLHTCVWVLGASLVAVAVACGVDHIPFIRQLSDQLGSGGMIIRVVIAGLLLVGITVLILSLSPLQEVGTLERLLARLPGPGGRYFGRRASSRSGVARAASGVAIDEHVPDQLNEALELTAGGNSPLTTRISLPKLAPVAGYLLPGAYVCEGRYRLLSYQGKNAKGEVTWLATDSQQPGKRVMLVTAADKVIRVPQPVETALIAAAEVPVAEQAEAQARAEEGAFTSSGDGAEFSDGASLDTGVGAASHNIATNVVEVTAASLSAAGAGISSTAAVGAGGGASADTADTADTAASATDSAAAPAVNAAAVSSATYTAGSSSLETINVVKETTPHNVHHTSPLRFLVASLVSIALATGIGAGLFAALHNPLAGIENLHRSTTQTQTQPLPQGTSHTPS